MKQIWQRKKANWRGREREVSVFEGSNDGRDSWWFIDDASHSTINILLRQRETPSFAKPIIASVFICDASHSTIRLLGSGVVFIDGKPYPYQLLRVKTLTYSIALNPFLCIIFFAKCIIYCIISMSTFILFLILLFYIFIC